MHASPHVRSNTLLGSEFHAVDSRFWVRQFQYLSVEFGFQIPIVSRTPASLSCILEFKAQDSGSHKHKFPRIPESTSKTLPTFHNPNSLTRGDMFSIYLGR